MRKTLWLALALILVPVSPSFADSLSISAWSQGNSLSATNLNLRHTEIQNVVNGLLDSSNLKAAAAIKGSQLDLSDGSGRLVQSATLTTDQRMFQSTPTWNGSTITFEAWFLNPTDTASASESLLMDLQLGGTSKFSIGKGTATRISGSGELPFIIASGPTLTFTGTTNISWQRFFRIDSPIITNTSAMTVTDAATVYIASGPRCQGNVTCTGGWALWTGNGDIRLDGSNVLVGTTQNYATNKGNIILANARSLRAVIAAGGDTYELIRLSGTTNDLILGDHTNTRRIAVGQQTMWFDERTDAAAPNANEVVIYAKDNGSGKTQLVARFATGAVQQIAIEP